MNGNIINFPGVATGEVPAEDVLNGALSAGLQDVIVIGWKAGEGEFFAATSGGSVGDNLLLLELARRNLIEAPFE